MKKIFSVIFILLAFLMTVGCFSNIKSGAAFADSISIFNQKKQLEKPLDENCIPSFNGKDTLKCKSAYLTDFKTGTVLFSQNESERYPIASMCKIMTLLLTFEELDNGGISLDKEIYVSQNAAGMGGSQVFLQANTNYMAGELIKSVVVASANDSSVALAEHICGSEELFVDKMNEKAASLSMQNTCFVNCTGLPQFGQYSSAKDVNTMFSELLKHKEYYLYSKIWMDEINHPEGRITEISNTNKLIRFYEGCDGGKTGYTSEAGHCLAASANRNGMRLVSVVISAPDSKTRFKESSDMFNFGFANYCLKTVVDCTKNLTEKVYVSGGRKDYIIVAPEYDFSILSLKNEKRSFEIVFNGKTKLKAPVKIGDFIGTLSVYENGIEIASVNVIAAEDVAKATYLDNINDVIENWQLF